MSGSSSACSSSRSRRSTTATNGSGRPVGTWRRNRARAQRRSRRCRRPASSTRRWRSRSAAPGSRARRQARSAPRPWPAARPRAPEAWERPGAAPGRGGAGRSLSARAAGVGPAGRGRGARRGGNGARGGRARDDGRSCGRDDPPKRPHTSTTPEGWHWLRFRRQRQQSEAVAVAKRDYYEVLGVARDADADAIRRAFHGLARDWHPDVAEAPDAEERFRELAEAYSVLSKRESRVLYDRYGYRGRGNQGFDDALWEARPPDVARGENIHTDLEVRSFEAEEGTRRVISFHATVRCPACMGHGVLSLPDPECEYCLGTGRKRTVAHL